MNWFGSPWPSAGWRAPVCEDDDLRVPTPVGATCMYCGEDIEPDDRGISFPGYADVDGWVDEALYAHIECNMRTIMGCSANLRGEPCDHSGSYREDARRVQAWLNDQWAFPPASRN